MKIICTLEERNNLMEVITAGCCWIGNGYSEDGKKKKTVKKIQKQVLDVFFFFQKRVSEKILFILCFYLIDQSRSNRNSIKLFLYKYC